MDRFEEYHLSNDARLVTDHVPGPESKKLIDFQNEYEGSIVSYPKSMPIAIKKAKGAIVEDVDGNQFIDFFAGCGVVNVGHCNPDVLARVKEQQDNLIHALDFPTQNKKETIEHILGNLPEHLQKQYRVSFCGPTGSDAVEAAIKLARMHTGRSGVVAFKGGYHGMTAAANAVTSNNKYRSKIPTQIANVHYIPYAYPYRWHQNAASTEEMVNQAVGYLTELLENPHSGIAKPACILIEPMQGEGGNIVPPQGYLEKLTAVAHKHDVVVIFDEIQCGFWRTGKFLDFMHSNAEPDIVTISKGLGGVGFPVSGLIYKRSIDSWGPGDHIGTFRGNQVSLAASNGAFEFVKANNLGEHATEMGQYLMQKFEELKPETQFMGEVRGKGLFIGVEFVKNRDTKEPFADMIDTLRDEALQRGLLFEAGGYYHNVLRIVPPLVVNKTLIDNFMRRFREALLATEAQHTSGEAVTA